ncbi:hemicentin-2 [Electrophorus electricus]|uniref:hemicentin-2 n=1 Tax=Electrophorus electricus TaxID=8005 RepID=UPI0015CFF36A|nr:hemicentin-2 [Electrophorus electricus]
MAFPLWVSGHMPCPVWLLVFSYSIRITPTQSALVFSTLPKDGVGVLNSPLMLHCAVYDSSPQRALAVTWEKDNGALGAGVQQMANGSLFFSQLQEEDMGSYICSAKKGSQQITAAVTVSKAYLDNVFFSPQSQIINEGQDVFFQCVSGDSSPPANISWLKNGRALTRGAQIQGQYGGGGQRKTSGTLHLVNTTKSDQGIYACVTFNSFLNISKVSSAATLAVRGFRGSLEITQGPENVTVPSEMEATLHCAVLGFPIPTVQWFKDGQILPNTSRWDLLDNGQLLVFERVLPEDEGLYHCEANNDQDRRRSQPAYLLPAVMDWMFVLQPTNKTVRKGDAVTLSCRPPDSRPPAQVSWFRNNRLLRPRPHFTMETTGDLLFHRVQETDRGYYFCRASNSYLRRAVASRKIFLEVLAPPSVTIRPMAVTSAVGGEVLLQCLVSGHPVPSIEWSKQGHSARTGGRIIMGVRNATLYISSVRIHDEGFYTCTASSSVGQDKKTTTLRVTVAAKPVIVWFVGSVNVSRGGTITLPCRANGNLPVKYSWTRMGLPIPLHPSPRIRVDDNGTLHISNANQSDIGEYYCTAQNGVGQDRRKAMVIVLSAEDDSEEDVLSSVQEIKPEHPNSTIYLKDSTTHSISASTPYITYNHDGMNSGGEQQHEHNLTTTEILLSKPKQHYPQPLELHAQNKNMYITSTILIKPNSQQATLDPHLQAPPQATYTLSSVGISQLSNLYQDNFSPTSLPQAQGDLTQTTRFTSSGANSIATREPMVVQQNWSHPSEQLGATKASRTNYTELVETLKKNTSKAPMKTADNNGREKSWLPVLEKHDIPIVVGVGVSLAFIFITMAFYSLFRQNDPAAVPTGRGALRGLGGPCRHGERLAVERTYDNRAFEDDNMVAVIEQSPNTSETRACPPLSSPSTLLMEPSYDDIQEEVQPIRDLSVIVESHPETSEEEQLETSFEEGKAIPSPQSDIQLQCLEDWRSRDFSQSQEALSPSPPAQSQPPEGLRSSLTLQTSEPSSAPLHHSISISHNSSPLLLSHCISLGMTSVAVDVRFYPSASSSDHPTPCSTFSPPGRQSSSRLEHEQTTASTQHGK